jgi:Sec-independent protein secretion pathway component TatC
MARARDQDQDGSDGPLGGGLLMSFGSHLDELRSRLFKAIVVPIALMLLIFMKADVIRDFLARPLMTALRNTGNPQKLQVLGPTESLMVDVQIAIWAAVIVSTPWILYQLWKFVSPGLYAHEQRYARLLVPLSAAMVALGEVLLWLALPFVLATLIGYGAAPARTVQPATEPVAGAFRLPVLEQAPERASPGDAWIESSDLQAYVAVDTHRADGSLEIRRIAMEATGPISQQFRLQEYVSFLLYTAAAIAIAFQMPVAVVLLGWIGVLDVRTLRAYRKHAFFACAIISLFITPTVDVMSLFLLMLPLYLLYELGIILLVIAPAQAVSEGGVIRNALGTMVGRPKYRPRRTDGDEGDE